MLYRSVGLSFLLMGAFVASAQEELDVARIGVAGLLLLRGLGYGQRIQNSWQKFQNNRPFIEQVGDAFELYERNTPQRGRPTGLLNWALLSYAMCRTPTAAKFMRCVMWT